MRPRRASIPPCGPAAAGGRAFPGQPLDRDPAQADRAALFLAAGASLDPGEAAGRTRTALLFDGHDEAAVAAARTAWRTTVAAGLKAAYWAQDAGR
ncbi:MAG: DNA polymerase III subunit chi, partial [Pseudomonadota bacterium]